MVAVAAVVVAIFRSAWRTLQSVSSFTGNNLVALIALLMAAEPTNQPSSTAVIYLLVGLLWALPLSQELTRRIPSIRFRLWPLSRGQKTLIYAANLLLNPLIVIAILFGLLSRDRLVGLGLAVVAVATPVAVLITHPFKRGFGWSPLVLVPRALGSLGGIVQSHIRELLQLLDFYFALLIAIGGLIYLHTSAKPDPETWVVIACFVVLLMSTCAQGHVTFDVPASQTRIQLLPVSGTAILFARDAGWMLVTIPLILGFWKLPAIAAALVALAIGHRTSIQAPIEQKRWHFASGRLAPYGIVQMMGLASAASAVQRWGWRALLSIVLLYGVSLWWSGRRWHRLA